MKEILTVIGTNLISDKNANHKETTRLQVEHAIRQDKNEEFNFGMVDNYVEEDEEDDHH